MRFLETSKLFHALACVVFSGLLLHCASSKMVLRDGVKVPIEEAARLDYAQAENFYVNGRFEQALPIFDRIQTQYPKTNYADNALWRMSQIFLKQGQNASAITALRQLFEKHPQSDVGPQAKLSLSNLYLSSGQKENALTLYASIPYSQLPAGEKEKVLKLFEQSDRDDLKLSWMIASYQDASNSVQMRAQLQERITQGILNAQNADHLRQLRSSENTFPQGWILFRLAQLEDQAGRNAQAKRYLETFLAKFPSHIYYPEALAMIQGLGNYTQPRSLGGPINIGILLPQTGARANYGKKIIAAIELAKQDFLKRHPQTQILFQYGDSGTDELAVANFLSLSQNPSLLTVIGPLSFEQTQQVASIAEQSRLPIFSLSAAENVADLNRFIFRNSITKLEQAQGLAYLCEEVLKCRNAAILYPDNRYGQEFSSLVSEAFQSKGIGIKQALPYQANQSNLTDQVKTLFHLTPVEQRRSEICSKKEAKRRKDLVLAGKSIRRCYPANELPPILDFDTLIIPDGYGRGKQVLSTLAYYNVAGLNILGPNLWNTPELTKNMSKSITQGVLFVDGFFKDKVSPRTQAFIKAYEGKYGQAPGILEAQAYDTALLIFNAAITGGGSSRADLLRALKSMQNFEGVTGTLSMQGNGEVRRRLTPLMVDGDKIKQLY